MKSLKILFFSICLIYAGRFIQYVITLATGSVETGDVLDPLLVIFKTIMVCGICLSIQVKVKSENGNLQSDVDLKKKAGHDSSSHEDGGKNLTIYSQHSPLVVEVTNDFPDQNSEQEEDDEDIKTYVNPDLFKQDMNNSIYHNENQ